LKPQGWHGIAAWGKNGGGAFRRPGIQAIEDGRPNMTSDLLKLVELEDPTTALAPVVAASFTYPFEADLARLCLEHAGIRARLADEATAGWIWHYCLAVGGVKVLVRRGDLRRAVELLEGAAATFPTAPRPAPRRRIRFLNAAPADALAEPWICRNCKEEVPGGWEVCWSCGMAAEGTEDSQGPAAESSGSAVPGEAAGPDEEPRGTASEAPGPPSGPASLPLGKETPARWACPRCGARVPGDFAACWACGTAPDGTEDPDFPTADAPIIEHDPDEPPSAWWPGVCLVLLPMAVYEMLDNVLPDRAQPCGRGRGRVTYAAVDHRLIRACLAAVFAIGWFPPFAFVSLWLLPGVNRGHGTQRIMSQRLVCTAVALNLLFSIPYMLFWFLILFRPFYP
jgi:RNA polymerase subunit RPABC4/transcription elongation factor Spt4